VSEDTGWLTPLFAAEFALGNQQWVTAAQKYREFFATRRDSRIFNFNRFRYRYAVACLKADLNDDAAKIAEKLLDAPRLEAELERAAAKLAYVARAKRPDAKSTSGARSDLKEAAQRFIKLNPSDPDALGARVMLAQNAGDTKGALALLAKVKSPASAQGSIENARFYVIAREFAKQANAPGAKLDALARPGVVLASNTSTLDIDAIASATKRPELVVGMHFFSPANVMRLLEIVRGSASSMAAIATAMDVGKRINKLNVVVGNCDGFVGNRITGKRGPQMEALLMEGALPQDIDRVMEGYGMAMGPCATGDLAGLDIGAAVRRARGTVAPIADALVALGRFGQKTGKGWYMYDEKRTRLPDPIVEATILDLAEKSQVRRRKIEDSEILERLLLPMVNEGAKILQEGIASRAIDIDVIFCNGFGWPAWRGGPMFWADRMGLKAVRDKLTHYAAATHDPNLKPAALIDTLAASGGSFATGAAKTAA
jgi:3-hydroxyacyl-CoA dehydrogenase